MATAAAKAAWRTEAGSRAVLDMEIPEEEIARAMDRAYATLVKRVNVPGFRRGKAPRPVLERHLGTGALREEALRDLLPARYEQAVREAGLSPVARPSFQVRDAEDGNGLRVTATVEVLPQIVLPDYRAIRVESTTTPVGDEDVDRVLDDLRARHGRVVSAPGEAAQRGDFVLVRVMSAPPGLERLQPGKEVLAEIGGGLLPAEVEAALAGARAGDDRSAATPEGAVQVHVLDVRRKELPALDDGFARLVSREPTLEALRARLRDRLAGERAEAEARDLRDRVVEAVLARVTIDLPESLVAREVEHRLEDLDRRLQARGLSRETYLRSQDKDEAQLRADLRPAAERRVRVRLLLDAVAEREGLAVSDDEVAQAVESLAQESGDTVQKMQAWLAQGDRLPALREQLLRQKALARLVTYAHGTPGAPEATAAGEAASQSPQAREA
jgi:trigger factor